VSHETHAEEKRAVSNREARQSIGLNAGKFLGIDAQEQRVTAGVDTCLHPRLDRELGIELSFVTSGPFIE
jgi:hypothetical protein